MGGDRRAIWLALRRGVNFRPDLVAVDGATCGVATHDLVGSAQVCDAERHRCTRAGRRCSLDGRCRSLSPRKVAGWLDFAAGSDAVSRRIAIDSRGTCCDLARRETRSSNRWRRTSELRPGPATAPSITRLPEWSRHAAKTAPRLPVWIMGASRRGAYFVSIRPQDEHQQPAHERPSPRSRTRARALARAVTQRRAPPAARPTTRADSCGPGPASKRAAAGRARSTTPG